MKVPATHAISLFIIVFLFRLITTYGHTYVLGGEFNDLFSVLWWCLASGLVAVLAFVLSRHLFARDVLCAYGSAGYFALHPLLGLYTPRVLNDAAYLGIFMLIVWLYLALLEYLSAYFMVPDYSLVPPAVSEPMYEGASFVAFNERVQQMGGYKVVHPCRTYSLLGLLASGVYAFFVYSSWSHLSLIHIIMLGAAVVGFAGHMIVTGGSTTKVCPEIKVVPLAVIMLVLSIIYDGWLFVFLAEPFFVIVAMKFYIDMCKGISV